MPLILSITMSYYKKMDKYGICGIEMKWFENYSSDRMQNVTYNSHKSSHHKSSQNSMWSTIGFYIGSHIVFIVYQ